MADDITSKSRLGPTPKSLIERLTAKVDKQGPVPEHRPELGPCWLWMGKGRTRNGYGQITLARPKRTEVVHRVAYRVFVGPIPEGLQLDHLCRNRMCVNPAHLEPVTNRENVLRGAGLPAKRARQTHCVNGHEFTSTNTYIRPNGGRSCLACLTERRRRYERARKELRNV